MKNEEVTLDIERLHFAFSHHEEIRETIRDVRKFLDTYEREKRNSLGVTVKEKRSSFSGQ